MIRLFLCALAVAGSVSSTIQAQQSRISGISELEKSRPFLRWERPRYQNFALTQFDNYPNHVAPYDDARRTIYGPMGDFLVNGYDLYFWEERRTPGQEYGSAIFKPNEVRAMPWEKVYNSTAIMKDGYGNWGFSFVVADNMIARLTPLTHFPPRPDWLRDPPILR